MASCSVNRGENGAFLLRFTTFDDGVEGTSDEFHGYLIRHDDYWSADLKSAFGTDGDPLKVAPAGILDIRLTNHEWTGLWFDQRRIRSKTFSMHASLP